MTVTLELGPDQIERLTNRSTANPDEVEAALYRLIGTHKVTERVTLSAKQLAAIALLDSWTAEDDTMSPEQRLQNDVEFEQLKANVNESRAEEGRAPAFR